MNNNQMDSAIELGSDRALLIEAFQRVRHETEVLCAPLSVDDYQIQSIVQTSPPKWHIAHVTWFYEAFVLSEFVDGYECFDPHYDYLFNSYYYTHGTMQPRPERGLLSRPTVEQVYRYRHAVDRAMLKLINDISPSQWEALAFRVVLGLNHEQQHQELLLMDIKHNFSVNPLKPAYREDLPQSTQAGREMSWVERSGGLHKIGSDDRSFHYDNETPCHQVLLRDHRLADRFVTNGEYLDFMQDGGYQQPALWLADGWALIQSKAWQAPLYWQQESGGWRQFTLGGLAALQLVEPVCHLSYFEADAYARWAGKRLPMEEELECMLAEQPIEGHFSDRGRLHPEPAGASGQWYGDLWAWTASPYTAYPGFKPLAGSMGEYNGKFMANQMVLKGGSCVTPLGHTRASYRNFFYLDERWAFTGLRLAEDM
ncbi:MAG: ergothioneine biosynthesis protein EgtB [Candidatus Thiodiazotropha sp.]